MIYCEKCGKALPDNASFCANCGTPVNIVDSDTLPMEVSAPKKKRFHFNRKLLLIPLVILLGAGITVYNSQPSVKYAKAERAFANGNYEKAIRYYTSLGEYEDAADKLTEATKANHYNKGQALFEAASYEEAVDEFEQASDYADSADMIAESNYNAAIQHKDAGELETAAALFAAAGSYSDAKDQAAKIAEDFVKQGQYETGLKIYQSLKQWKNYPYAQYAQGIQYLNDKDYIKAASAFYSAKDVLDAKSKYTEASYESGMSYFRKANYSNAQTAFNNAGSYKDAETMVTASALYDAKTDMNDGNLNEAKEKLEALPSDFSYNDVSVADLLSKINANPAYVAVCGKWTSTGGQMRVTQTGSYGYSTWWYRDFNEGELDLTVKCKIADDGTVTIVTDGYVPIYTRYSSIREGLELNVKSISTSANGSSLQSITIDDYTTLSLTSSKITATYKKVDRSQDVYFTYTYKTSVTYGKRTEAY